MKIIKPNTLTLASCSVSETDDVDGATWASGTTYSTGDLVRYQHISYKSLKDSNVGNTPPDNISGDDPYWQKVGATMPYRMLDDYVETTTDGTAGGTLTFSVTFSRGDSIALLNMTGVEVDITIVDSADSTTVLNEEISLIEDIDSLSLYEYYFSPIVTKDVYVNTNLAIIISGTMTVTIKSGGGTTVPSIGHVIVGRRQTVGETKYGAEVGITDYSKKETDEFGVTSFVKRSYAKNASVSLFTSPNRADKIATMLYDVRSTPILIQGSNVDTSYAAMTIYGWIEDWRMVYEGPNEQEISVEVQGLI